jgi:DNA repair protein RadC
MYTLVMVVQVHTNRRRPGDRMAMSRKVVRGLAELYVLQTPAAGTLRLVREGSPATTERQSVRGPRDAAAIMAGIFMSETAEAFYVIMLDVQHRVIGDPVLITRGILDSSLVHPREVFRPAILVGSAAIVVAHNHPSGDPDPSRQDRAVTTQLVAAGLLLGIPVNDHVVVGGGNYRSFAEMGIL